MVKKQDSNIKSLKSLETMAYTEVLTKYMEESTTAPKELQIVYEGVIYGLSLAGTMLLDINDLKGDFTTMITALSMLSGKRMAEQQLHKVGVITINDIAEMLAKEGGIDLDELKRNLDR